ncbi:MAG: DUF962 domain-containing protein [Pseudomonadota bacterium]|nr:DUF962 domain-containing protein [Pseudomonadota bacterium]
MEQNLSNTAKTALSNVAKDQFYQFYLGEHQNPTCRQLHFLGSTLGILGATQAIRKRSVKPLIKGIVAGYACAWVGHFFFEHNKPASFKQPLKSFVSDFRMFGDIVRGQLSLIDPKQDRVHINRIETAH